MSGNFFPAITIQRLGNDGQNIDAGLGSVGCNKTCGRREKGQG